MSDRSVPVRRPLAMGAAVLLAAATFLAATSGPVAAGRPLEFTVTPDSAEVGDTVTATSDVPCYRGDVEPTAEVTLIDADDNVVSSIAATMDDEGDWTADIDTTGLDEGDYTVEARCVYGEDQFNNYQSESLTLTAPDVDPTTTTTTEAETTTTSEPTTSTTDAPETTTAPAVDEEPDAAPADAVASTPNYTG